MSDNIHNSNDDTKLFMSLILSSQKDLYVYILSLVLSPSDTDDILQDTLTIMWRKFGDYESGTNFVAWGKQIARYKVMEYLRKNKSSKLCFDSEVLKIIESQIDHKDDLSDRKQAMRDCLKKLAEKQMSMLKMRYVQDMSYKQIALQYGISKQSLYRAISRIHLILTKCIKYSLRGGEFYGN